MWLINETITLKTGHMLHDIVKYELKSWSTAIKVVWTELSNINKCQISVLHNTETMLPYYGL